MKGSGSEQTVWFAAINLKKREGGMAVEKREKPAPADDR